MNIEFEKITFSLLFLLGCSFVFAQNISATNGNPTSGTTPCGNCVPAGWTDNGGTPDISNRNNAATAVSGAAGAGGGATWTSTLTSTNNLTLPLPPNNHTSWLSLRDLGPNLTEESVTTNITNLLANTTYEVFVYSLTAVTNANGYTTATSNSRKYAGVYNTEYYYTLAGQNVTVPNLTANAWKTDRLRFTATNTSEQLLLRPGNNANGGTSNSINYNQFETVQLSVTLNAVNAVPIAINDNATTLQGVPVQINVATNDTDINGAIVASTVRFANDQTSFTNAQGTWSINTTTGVVTFSPAAGFFGIATIPYTVQDNFTLQETTSTSPAVPVSVSRAATSNAAVISVNVARDTDGDGVADNVDLDDDNDGILDTSEGTFNAPQWTAAQLDAVKNTPFSASIGSCSSTFSFTNGSSNLFSTQSDNVTPGIFRNIINAHTKVLLSASQFSIAGRFDLVNTAAGTDITRLNIALSPGAYSGYSFYISDLERGFVTVRAYSASGTALSTANWVIGRYNQNGGASTAIVAPVVNSDNVVLNDGAGTAITYDAYAVTFDYETLKQATRIEVEVSKLGGNTDAIFYATTGTCIIDSDNDGISNHLEVDSDNDGCPDAIEGTEQVRFSQVHSLSLPTTDSNYQNRGQIKVIYNGITAGTPAQIISTSPSSNGVPQLVNPATVTGVNSNFNSGTNSTSIAGIADNTDSPTPSSEVGQGVGTSQDRLVKDAECDRCFRPATSPGVGGIATNHGITALSTAGSESADWPGKIKGAYTALNAKTKGFVINRLTTAQINDITTAGTAVVGMMVYDTTVNCLKIYDNSGSWKCFNNQSCDNFNN